MNMPPAYPPVPQPYPQAPQHTAYAPPQPYPQAVPQPVHPPVAPLMQSVAQNAMSAMLTGPRQQRANRSKPMDSDNIVQFMPDSKVFFSNKDSSLLMLLQYRVLESTAPSNQNQEFGHIIKLITKYAFTELAEILKVLLPPQELTALAANPQTSTPQYLAELAVHRVKSVPTFAHLRVRRNPGKNKTTGQPLPYDELFAQHDYLAFYPQAISLAQSMGQLRPQAPAPMAVPAPQSYALPAPQAPPLGMPPQAAVPQPPPAFVPPQQAPYGVPQPPVPPTAGLPPFMTP